MEIYIAEEDGCWTFHTTTTSTHLRGESLDSVRAVMKEYHLHILESEQQQDKDDEEWIE